METSEDAFFGPRLRASRVGRWLSGLPVERRDVSLTVLFSLLILIPYLGAVGLWDPWEVHYGEVARAMVDRQDYVFPFWENAYFFSKPALTMWLQALGIAATGSLAEHFGPLGIYTEWGMRLPFALLSALAVGLVTLAIGRVFNRRAGLIAGFALATSPLWFMLSRQTVTDTPFVLLMVGGFACFLVAEFAPGTTERQATGWWCFAYVFFALATLAKGLLGFMLPGLILLVYILLTWDWALLKRARIVHGLVLLLLIAGPWYLTLSLFQGVDDEGLKFAARFFVHDHFRRIGEGVHTTTPGGSFDYFIEQLGFAVFPWVALLPGAFVVMGRVTLKDRTPQARATLFIALWAIVAFFVFTFSITKFHHYCFPVVPPLAILCALFADTLWKEGIEKHAIALLVGLGFFGAVAQNLGLEPKRLINLFVYQYDRAYPISEVDARPVFAVLFALAGAACVGAYFGRSRRVLFGAFGGLAAAFALYVSWGHWTQLTFHWSQRDVFWAYYQQRGNTPPEPIGAYYLNWRGETFYSSNTVRQIKDATKMSEFLAQDGRVWFIVEQSRYNTLKNAVEQKGRLARIADRSNNKYYLVATEPKPRSSPIQPEAPGETPP